jgi:prohibitin 1
MTSNDMARNKLGPKSKKRLRRLTSFLSVTAITGILCLVLLWDSMVYTTPVGHTSVVWHRFSFDETQTSEGPLKEGTHVIWPWDKHYTYDARLQTSDQIYEVVTADGLHVEITMTFRWRVVRNNIVDLNSNVGPNYLQTLLVPVVGSVSREVISQYDAEKLYSTEREDIQKEIYQRIVSQDYPNGIGVRETAAKTEEMVILEDSLIKSVRLPAGLQSAIEQKLEQEQLVQGYVFRVEREGLESQRKEVEAQGIRRFQEIVTPAINESYLRWRGIEATLQLAQSPNAKVIVIGNSETGLPLILDTSGQNMPLPAGVSDGAEAIHSSALPVSRTVMSNGDEEVITPVPENDGQKLETGDVNDTVAPMDLPAAKTGTAPSQ